MRSMRAASATQGSPRHTVLRRELPAGGVQAQQSDQALLPEEAVGAAVLRDLRLGVHRVEEGHPMLLSAVLAEAEPARTGTARAGR